MVTYTGVQFFRGHGVQSAVNERIFQAEWNID